MKHSNRYEVCTDPLSGMDAAFHHVSYALFRTDARMGRVIAARFPDRRLLGLGSRMEKRLAFSREVATYMVHMDEAPPLFFLTAAGLGVLSKRYDLQVGLGLFAHIHCRPEIGARLLCEGALGAETGASFSMTARVREMGSVVPKRRFRAKEEATYAALSDAWRALQCFGREPFPVDGSYGLSCVDLQDTLTAMAAFAGCGLEFLPPDGPLPSRVKCYRPRVAEALLLYIFSEVREFSATRTATCRIGYVRYHDGPRLRVNLRYPFEEHSRTLRVCRELAEVRRYIQRVASFSGVRVEFPGICLSDEDRRLHRLLGSPDYGVTLEWCEDPFLAATGALRAYLPDLRGRDLGEEEI